MTAPVQKYALLTRYLLTQPGERLTLTFAAIEAILGAELPVLAGLRSWWTNAPTRADARAWLYAGWRVASVDLDRRCVTFERRPASTASSTAAPCSLC